MGKRISARLVILLVADGHPKLFRWLLQRISQTEEADGKANCFNFNKSFHLLWFLYGQIAMSHLICRWLEFIFPRAGQLRGLAVDIQPLAHDAVSLSAVQASGWIATVWWVFWWPVWWVHFFLLFPNSWVSTSCIQIDSYKGDWWECGCSSKSRLKKEGGKGERWSCKMLRPNWGRTRWWPYLYFIWHVFGDFLLHMYVMVSAS